MQIPDVELCVDEQLRPRVLRKMGLPLPLDEAVDALTPPSLWTIRGALANACRIYRRVRPRAIGDRCAFEPSCSRYAELSFRALGVRRGILLTIRRLARCNAKHGGLDLPKGIDESKLKVGALNEISG